MRRLYSLFMLLFLCGCTNAVESKEVVETESKESIETTIDRSESVMESYEQLTLYFKDFTLEENEQYYVGEELEDLSSYQISFDDPSIASFDDDYVTGLKEGNTIMNITSHGKVKKVNVSVVKQGSLSDSFVLDFHHLYGKKIACFGDSNSADATYANKDKTYVSNIANYYNMTLTQNYSIGGTTATYMFKGSNIEKEYKNNTTAIDGCRKVYYACAKGEMRDVDYVFIAFGHNDQYFQPPITVEGDERYCVDDTFVSCNSYKGSYRYMINVLRKANPNIRIIILNCTYSRYDKATPTSYSIGLTYADYRRASQEVAEETKCKLIDPWDYLKDYYDGESKKYYYHDTVHLSVEGHKLLTEYLKNK